MKTTASFHPYLIENQAEQCLTQLNLDFLLKKTTEHKLTLLRGFPALAGDKLMHYCASQATLLHWEFGPVMEMKPSADAKNYLFTHGDVPLHWDGAFYQEPRFLVFHCLQAPLNNTGGETLFVNTEQFWQEAEAGQKSQWADYELSYSTAKLAHYGGQIKQKLVAKHPDTDRIILRFAEPVGEDYLNPVDVCILGKTQSQSNVILNALSQAIRKSRYCYQHTWQTGDYLIADNFSLLHGRNAFSRVTPRHLRRIQII